MCALFDCGVVLAKPASINRPWVFRAVERFFRDSVIAYLIQPRRPIADERLVGQDRVRGAVFIQSMLDLPLYLRSLNGHKGIVLELTRLSGAIDLRRVGEV